MTLNGKTIDRCYVTYEQLMEGGTLDFTLSAEPDRTWGTDPAWAPYSYTTRPTVSIPSVANDLSLFDGEITAELKVLGILYVTLDLQGFRSGSMDEALKR